MNDESKNAQLPPAAEQTDAYLQSLVKVINDAPERLSLPMTVLVGGTLVSGALISAREFFELFAAEFSEVFTDPDDVATVKNSADSDEPAPSEDDRLPQYIHFKDAKYYSAQGGPIIAGPGVSWRGRIAEVAGFHFGCLAPMPTDDE